MPELHAKKNIKIKRIIYIRWKIIYNMVLNTLFDLRKYNNVLLSRFFIISSLDSALEIPVLFVNKKIKPLLN